MQKRKNDSLLLTKNGSITLGNQKLSFTVVEVMIKEKKLTLGFIDDEQVVQVELVADFNQFKEKFNLLIQNMMKDY